MDSIFGIGLPELFFIAILALVILGPERLPGTLRQIAKAWGYMRNLGRELTSQFSEEFKALEDLNPRKILNEMADEELAKDLKSLTKGAKPTTAATSKPATTKPAAKPTTTASSTTSKTNTTTASSAANKNTPANAKSADSASTSPPTGANSLASSTDASNTGATSDEKEENSILPPPAERAVEQASPPTEEPTTGKTPDEMPGERTPLASTVSVSVNGASNPGESAG